MDIETAYKFYTSVIDPQTVKLNQRQRNYESHEYDEELYQNKDEFSPEKMSEMDKLYKAQYIPNTIESIDYTFNLSSYGSTNYGKHQNGASPAVYMQNFLRKQVIENSSLNFTSLNTVKYQKRKMDTSLSLGHVRSIDSNCCTSYSYWRCYTYRSRCNCYSCSSYSSSVRYASYYFWLSSEDFSYF